MPWGTELGNSGYSGSFTKNIADSMGLAIISFASYKYNSIALQISSKISGGITSMAHYASDITRKDANGNSKFKDMVGDLDKTLSNSAPYKVAKEGVENITKRYNKAYKNSRDNYKNSVDDRYANKYKYESKPFLYDYKPKSIYNNVKSIAKSVTSGVVNSAAGVAYDATEKVNEEINKYQDYKKQMDDLRGKGSESDTAKEFTKNTKDDINKKFNFTSKEFWKARTKKALSQVKFFKDWK